jgi:L-iditol 2-dehydrogenase
MKALLLTAPSRLEYTDVPEPEVAEDDVLVRVRACGICGSDLHGWDGSSGRRRPPLIMGHEASGEVVRSGPRAGAWRAGDRVTFDSTLWCGTCAYCAAGQVNLCENRRVVGVAPAEYRQHGAFAEYVALPGRVLYRLPDALTFERAAMVEPTSIAVHAVRRAMPDAGSTAGRERVSLLGGPASAVVVGSGMIGLLVIQVLRWAGVARVLAVDREPARLELARRFGAAETLLAGGDAESIAAEIQRRTAGRGVDFAFEVVGASATLGTAIGAVRRGGTVVLVGNVSPKTEFPMQVVVTRELTLLGTCGSSGEYELCLELLATGTIAVDPMISAVRPLAEGAEWFSRLSSRDGAAYFKVMLAP